jgi:PhnB protein
MILIIAMPERYFDQAILAGSKVVFPIGVEHGWKLGRLVDPFGHHWEIGHPIENPL